MSDVNDFFPPANPDFEPVGYRVLVQIRMAKKKTSGGILLPDDTRDAVSDNTQVAKVISAGPTAFCNRDTLKKWPEGDWCKPGDFVRVPKYISEAWKVKYGSGADDYTTFAVVRDLDIIGKVTGDQDKVIAYV